MTAPLPSLSVQQLTEQLEELRPVIDWLRVDRPRPFDDLPDELRLHWLTRATEVADLAHPALLATIRRLQAACDAVTELAGQEASVSCDPDEMEWHQGHAEGRVQAARSVLRALASPGTEQEAQV